MSTNGNGTWFHSYWMGWIRVNNPKKHGWYAARPGCCKMTVRVFIDENLFDCRVDGSDLKYNVEDFDWWYPLKKMHEELPKFEG
jgi:hypothetical protein